MSLRRLVWGIHRCERSECHGGLLMVLGAVRSSFLVLCVCVGAFVSASWRSFGGKRHFIILKLLAWIASTWGALGVT
eukprot:7387202-Prymnesium_polylepis.1